jgi:pyruvate dehydrogenase E2 component (dihydrolipoamide acetyltransferase)
MARFEFKLPDIGEGVYEGEIVTWHVRPGELVAEDQPVVEVMTDKATVTIGAPKAGKILETRGAVGEVVNVNSVLVVFELDGQHGESDRGDNGSAKSDGGAAASACGDLRDDLPGIGAVRRAAATRSLPVDKALATPAIRKMARDLGVDISAVVPTGPDGRVTEQDVRAAAVGAGAVPAASPSARPVSTALQSEERIPLKGIRRKSFENVARSKQTAAHFTVVEECDVTALKALRDRLKVPAAEQGVKLTFLPFIVKAVLYALKRHPVLNSTFDEAAQEIVIRRYFNIGIATATENGLLVPVVKNVDKLTLLEVAREILRLADDARSGRIKVDELSGGTFTITSLGDRGGLFATPIINFPEVAILGIHRMKQKPVVRAGQIVIGDVMLMSLSFDHRIIDGDAAAAFTYDFIGSLERPEALLLDVG